MKRLLTILAFLLLAAPAMAFDGACQDGEPWQLARMNPAVLGSGGAVTTAAHCDDSTHDGTGNAITLCEDFDGSVQCGTGYTSTCRNTWSTTTGTPDFDGTAITNEGTYSLNMTDTTRLYTSFDLSEAWAFLKLKSTIITPSAWDLTVIYGFYASDGNRLCVLTADRTGGSTIYWGVYSNAYTKGSLVVKNDTLYYIWLHYKAGSVSPGNDGICTAYISETSTKPSATVSKTDCTLTQNAGRLQLESSDNKIETIQYDHIRINSATIGDNPD